MRLISFSDEIKDLKTNRTVVYYSIDGLKCKAGETVYKSREEMYKNIFKNGRI